LLATFCLASGLASGADSVTTRVGTCSDAKNQWNIFHPANAASDSVVALGTPCNNAKKMSNKLVKASR